MSRVVQEYCIMEQLNCRIACSFKMNGNNMGPQSQVVILTFFFLIALEPLFEVTQSFYDGCKGKKTALLLSY